MAGDTRPSPGPTGALILMPNTLDHGTPGVDMPLDELLPRAVIRSAAGLAHWVAENARSARAFLKRVDAVVPLVTPLQGITIVELPRPPKGRPMAPRLPGMSRVAKDAIGAAPIDPAIDALLTPTRTGHDLGLIAEAGLPAIADPGATLVAAAHRAGIRVVALPGPSSLLLALATSGLNGQSFAFVGYLPVEQAARAARIRELEAVSARLGQTQLAIETPYRNPALLAALVAHLAPATQLSVACGLTLIGGFNRSDRVADWRARPLTLPTDVPAVFAWAAG